MPTNPPKYTVGKDVAVSVGGALAYVTGGNIDDVVSLLNKSNARSGGFQERAAGLRGAKGTLQCVFNAADVVVIEPGARLDLLINISAPVSDTTRHGKVYTVTVLVGQVTDNWQEDQDHTWSFTFESTGAYTVAALP